MTRDELARFMAFVDQTSRPPHWIWTGAKSKRGYGRFKIGGKMRGAHRVSLEHFKGPIPPGMVADHQCEIPSCVNPAHLLPASVSVNATRGRRSNARKTHCPKGHPLSGTNVYDDPRGFRGCRRCRAEAHARQAAKSRRRRKR